MKNVDIRNMVVWLKMADGSMKPFFSSLSCGYHLSREPSQLQTVEIQRRQSL